MWVKVWVRGKSVAECYDWFDDEASNDELRDAAQEWASHTSQGILNDYYKYGFERVKRLPESVRLNLINRYKNNLRQTKLMLKVLGPTKKANKKG